MTDEVDDGAVCAVAAACHGPRRDAAVMISSFRYFFVICCCRPPSACLPVCRAVEAAEGRPRATEARAVSHIGTDTQTNDLPTCSVKPCECNDACEHPV